MRATAYLPATAPVAAIVAATTAPVATPVARVVDLAVEPVAVLVADVAAVEGVERNHHHPLLKLSSEDAAVSVLLGRWQR